jgi:hypothetical protein
MLLRADDNSQPELEKADSAGIDPANPLNLSLAIWQPAPIPLPFQFSSPLEPLPGAPSSHGRTKKDTADPTATLQGDGLETSTWPVSVPTALLPVAPPPEPAYSQTAAHASTASSPPSHHLLELTQAALESRKGDLQSKDVLDPSGASRTMHDDAAAAPRVVAEVVPTFAAPPSTVAFQATLTPAKGNAGESQVMATSASPVVKQTAPDTSGQKPSDQQQDAQSNNPVPATKSQPRPPIEPDTDRAAEIELNGVSNVVPHPQNAAAASPSASAPVADRPAETPHRPPNAPSVTTSLSGPPEPAHAPAPVRDLSLRLTSATNEQVDIKVQDKGGQLSVVVHSNSPELSADLRQQVGDLVSKLDRAGIHTEIEKPGSSSLSAQSSGPSGEGKGQEFSGQNQQQREDQPEPNQQESAHRAAANATRNRQPEWVQTMSGILSTGEREGVTNR